MTSPGMEALSFEDVIGRLRLAEELVRDETEQLAQAGARDRAVLLRFSELAVNYREQANSLLLSMLDQAGPEDVLIDAEELAGFFNETVERIEDMLATG